MYITHVFGKPIIDCTVKLIQFYNYKYAIKNR